MLNYRPDIDGLRAIAVGSVVLYHLRESWLPGGFVGVDIFFVISGYLITKLIFKELSETDSFSFKRFYIRRIRRLFPALLATLLFSVVLAYALLSPAHIIEFAQSLIAAIFSVSNFYFWNIAGYFDSDSALKPLLHTWSLSVEEQFYFIWPAVMLGLFAFRRPKLIPAFIAVMGLLSLLLNVFFFSVQIDFKVWFEDNLDIASTAFYWLPFRVFEFSIGAILVWLGTARKSLVSEVSFVAGCLMVAASVFLLNSKMAFPSTTALLPCIGAALLIYSGPNHRLSALLSNRLMVGIGLISYSLYLIHWPLIVFYKYWTGAEFSTIESAALVGVSVVLAYLMYRFVEQPFRKANTSKATGNKSFLVGALAAVLAIVSLSAHAITSQGWLGRYPADVVAQLSYKQGDYTEFFWANIHRLERDFDNSDKPKVLIIGDSMAADMVNVLVAADAENELDIVTIEIGNNCKTLFGLSESQYPHLYGGAAQRCQAEHNKALDNTRLLASADTIVLASYWWDINHLDYIPKTISHLRTLTDARLMVQGLKVQISNGIWFLNKHAFSPQAHLLRTPPHPKTVSFNQRLVQASGEYQYFDLLDGFCDQDGCQRVTKEGYAIVFDENHFSENGARFVARDAKSSAWYRYLLQRKTDTD